MVAVREKLKPAAGSITGALNTGVNSKGGSMGGVWGHHHNKYQVNFGACCSTVGYLETIFDAGEVSSIKDFAAGTLGRWWYYGLSCR